MKIFFCNPIFSLEKRKRKKRKKKEKHLIAPDKLDKSFLVYMTQVKT